MSESKKQHNATPTKKVALRRRNKAGKQKLTRQRLHRLNQLDDAAVRTGRIRTIRMERPLGAYPNNPSTGTHTGPRQGDYPHRGGRRISPKIPGNKNLNTVRNKKVKNPAKPRKS